MLPLNLVILKTVTVYCQLYLFGIITENLYSVKFINTLLLSPFNNVPPRQGFSEKLASCLTTFSALLRFYPQRACYCR